jgi:hypothetical protein
VKWFVALTTALVASSCAHEKVRGHGVVCRFSAGAMAVICPDYNLQPVMIDGWVVMELEEFLDRSGCE